MAGKILGSVLIVAACFCMGYRLSIREKLRLDELIFFKIYKKEFYHKTPII